MHEVLKILLLVFAFTNAELPIASAPIGKFKGTITKSRLGKTIYSFTGIQFAEAPVGELRFQPPVPIGHHEGIYNATVDAPLCPQPFFNETQEDCLYLNVYTTKLPNCHDPNVKKPVIVFMHPGGFYASGSKFWGPVYLLDHDLVLVTINYRLGSLGFLALGEKESPGNNGFKDQVAALKWVKANILAFGGDPELVTLMGNSAGAISVVLHMLSPMSVGLFHRAAALSNSPTTQVPIGHDELELARKQARFVGCPDDTASNIYKCLKTASAEDLGDSLLKFGEFDGDPLLLWRSVIEKDFGQERFLTDHPITLIKNNKILTKVPFMTGVTKDEFGQRALIVLNNQTLLDRLNNEWYETAPIPFLYERNTSYSRVISKGLKEFYFNNKKIDNSQEDNLAHLYADSLLGFGVNRAAKLMSEHNSHPTFYYRYSYQGDYSFFYYPNTNKTYGVVHMDDLIYLFDIPAQFPVFNATGPKEIEIVEKLTRLYANFAKHGTPTPRVDPKLDNVKWETFNNKTQKYLDIGNKLVIRERLYEKRYEEWEKLFPLSFY
ncbi:unnamed protein product [Ceutorhynchus assimilis]|uniref:Carboxylic ester hydrolase n=1 Tax=Ceutorhynchus assimilis TaxID=467358 RepID=A0A9P0DJN8_9CUCU|nr:unnamed protein product [Ceutorhynchus assimilis]